jgi:serine protease AprX
MPLYRRLIVALALVAASVPAAAQTAESKLDESLRESLQRGCVGMQPVIIRTKAGYRQALRDSLAQHGDVVKGEFPSLDAISAEVHCADLTMLAGFDSTISVSLNAPVATQTLGLVTSLTTADAKAAVDAAKADVVAAKAVASTAQKAVRAAESVVFAAQAPVTAAQRAVNAAKRLSEPFRTAALQSAQIQLATAQSAYDAAKTALEQAVKQATAAETSRAAATGRLVDAQEAWLTAAKALAGREREGRAARGLKRRFFATLPLRGDLTHVSDDQFEEAIDENDNSLQTLLSVPSTYSDGNVGVAVIDSGIEPGIDFDTRITAFYDFTLGDIRAVAPHDGYGHGTHVAGLIASEFVGVAPNVRLIGLKVLKENGQGATDNVVRAIEFAIANKDLLGIHILNLSLGHPIYEPAASDPLVQAVEHAVRSGLTVMVSAGNFGINPVTGQPGYAGITSPANAPSAIAVGAVRSFNTVTRKDDRVAPYSSRGPSWYDGFAKPDLVAPGDNLLSIAAAGSTLRAAQELRGNTGSYMRLSGTSMAAGVASGVAALVLQANRRLTPNTVKAILEYTAIPVGDDAGTLYDPLTQGAGQIEVPGAVALARSINPNVPLGSPWLSTSFTPSTVIGGHLYMWSQSVVWGNRRVIGKQLMNEHRPAWSLNIVWGEGLGKEDDNIVWGNNFNDDNIVWGNSFDSDDNIVWGNNIVWGMHADDNIVWGNLIDSDDNIVWGNSFDSDDNIVWGNNIVWGMGLLGMSLDDNIVWGNNDDNIVWGNLDDDNIVWGNLFDDNIVWGNSDDNIVWGNTAELGNVIRWTGGIVTARASNARARRARLHSEGVQ